jgi:hypothetical protein
VSWATPLARIQRGVILSLSLPVVRDFHRPERFRRECAKYRHDAHRAPSLVGIVYQLSDCERRGNHADMEQMSRRAERGVRMVEGLAVIGSTLAV